MSATEKRRQALLKKQKKQGLRPEGNFTIKPSNLMKKRERNQYTQAHAHELLSIEAAIVNCFTENASLDDLSVAQALRAAVDHEQPNNDHALFVWNRLRDTGAERLGELAEGKAVWLNGQRAILTSVCDTSGLAAGEQTYLRYARDFIKRANG